MDSQLPTVHSCLHVPSYAAKAHLLLQHFGAQQMPCCVQLRFLIWLKKHGRFCLIRTVLLRQRFCERKHLYSLLQSVRLQSLLLKRGIVRLSGLRTRRCLLAIAPQCSCLVVRRRRKHVLHLMRFQHVRSSYLQLQRQRWLLRTALCR